MSNADIPQEVLSDALSKAINGRRVRCAVFTTFTFDPGFFELNILPLFFDQTFSSSDKIRLIQLEDALTASMDKMAVYYDRTALVQDARPAVLDYKRLGVRRRTGVFHPKTLFLLVDEPAVNYETEDEDGNKFSVPQSLIVSVMSANLTQSGWWQNVECAHIEEIKDKTESDDRISYRKDLLELLSRVRSSSVDDEPHDALEKIRTFLRKRVVDKPFKKRKINGRYLTRLFCGQDTLSFPQWLKNLRIGTGWNLEIISPYFDKNDLRVLLNLTEITQPKEVRLYLPEDNGMALITEDIYWQGQLEKTVHWAGLPEKITIRGQSGTSESLLPRRVHAKVYRFWNRDGDDIVITGSVNLTSSAHSHSGSGNLEAAFLVDVSSVRSKGQWWLKRHDGETYESFSDDVPQEEDGLDIAYLDVSLRFDWVTHKLEYRLGGKNADPFSFMVISGKTLFSIEKPSLNKWVSCSRQAAKLIESHLENSSFAVVHHKKGSWRLLIQEDNMPVKPSLLNQLSPEEILEYWSLFTADQKAMFLERVLNEGIEVDGLPLRVTKKLADQNTLFDRFAGIYHAFGSLKKAISSALDEGRDSAAITHLLGAKYDSLPTLLEKVRNNSNTDTVIKYVTFLSAAQLKKEIFKDNKDFYYRVKDKTKLLDRELRAIVQIRKALSEELNEEADDFLEWYEKAFLVSAVVREGAR